MLHRNIGESIKIGEDENGELWVTLTDKTQNITRSNTLTDVHTYLFTYTDFWGKEKDGFKIRLEDVADMNQSIEKVLTNFLPEGTGLSVVGE